MTTKGNRDRIRLQNRIARLESKLEELKCEYIVKYEYNDLTIDSDGQVHGGKNP